MSKSQTKKHNNFGLIYAKNKNMIPPTKMPLELFPQCNGGNENTTPLRKASNKKRRKQRRSEVAALHELTRFCGERLGARNVASR
jgi:hypothetical protein